MEQSEIYKKEAVWMNVRHLGIIFSNLCFFCGVITILIPISSFLAFFGIAVLVLLLLAFTVAATLFTAGFVWTTPIIKDAWAWFNKASDNATLFADLLGKVLPYFALLGAVLGFASALVLQFIRQDKRTGRIVAGYIIGAICAFVCILAFAGVFAQ